MPGIYRNDGNWHGSPDRRFIRHERQSLVTRSLMSVFMLFPDPVEKSHGGDALCLHGDVHPLVGCCSFRSMGWPKKVPYPIIVADRNVCLTFVHITDSLRYEKSGSLIPNECKIWKRVHEYHYPCAGEVQTDGHDDQRNTWNVIAALRPTLL